MSPWILLLATCPMYAWHPNQHGIVVDLNTSTLHVYRCHLAGLEPLYEAPVSYSKAEPSTQNESFGTPLGWHRICRKIGDGYPVGAQFKYRKWTGWIIPQSMEDRGVVLTRILQLVGLEWGKNLGIDPETQVVCDSYQRTIYIHGTNRDALVPQRITRGCLCLKTNDLLNVFNIVRPGDWVWIGRL